MNNYEKDNCYKPKHGPGVVDLCVPVVYAIDDQTGKKAFVDTNIFAFPSSICRVECENVEITGRSIKFNCDRLFLCVDYILCLKFFPKVGTPYCQTFQGCFTKEIKFKEFISTFDNRHISIEEFSSAQGACVEVEVAPKFGCFNKLFNLTKIDPCLTLIINFIRFNVRVKLFQEHNVMVQGFVGEPVVRLPREVDSGCSFEPKSMINDFFNRGHDTDRVAGEVKDSVMPNIEEFKKEAWAEVEKELRDF